MDNIPLILKELEGCQFKISTDTRKDVSGSIYFALKGQSFDGNTFIDNVLEGGAVGAVTDNPSLTGSKIYLVDDVLKALQTIARTYRNLFSIPIIVIAGSNGKTTSKELIREILKTKYRVHSTSRNLNNHVGVPLSILSMDRDTEIAIFEIGANHPGEHLELLEILNPTMVVITNNGMDHLEGFGSPLGVRKANKEVYDWALSHNRVAFVDKNNPELMEDSVGLERMLYPSHKLSVTNSIPLSFTLENTEYATNLVGNYNIENIHLALAIGTHFGISPDTASKAVSKYGASIQRSQFVEKNNINFIVDCYNANPSSMHLALQSFLETAREPRGIILGDMFELGPYTDTEHQKIVDCISKESLSCVIFIGNHFKNSLSGVEFKYHWFPNSEEAQKWFAKQEFGNFTFLLKGSRSMKIEKILDL